MRKGLGHLLTVAVREGSVSGQSYTDQTFGTYTKDSKTMLLCNWSCEIIYPSSANGSPGTGFAAN
jgi:hypothetical protein